MAVPRHVRDVRTQVQKDEDVLAVIPLRYDDMEGRVGSPLVDLVVNGVVTTFIVDTGAVDTTVTPQQVVAWGFSDIIDLMQGDGPKVICVNVDVNTTTGQEVAQFFRVVVREQPWNLLGLNFLAGFCTQIKLDPHHPTLTVRWPADVQEVEDWFLKVFTVAGQEQEVLPDTGYTGFLQVTLPVALKLGLDLIGVEKGHYNITPYGPVSLTHEADDVLVAGSGHEAHGIT